jgi:hypothetical protein
MSALERASFWPVLSVKLSPQHRNSLSFFGLVKPCDAAFWYATKRFGAGEAHFDEDFVIFPVNLQENA